MSSSNLVRVTFIEETTYGVTPVAGNFKTARFTSDSLSGSPDTTESQQIRTDRMSSGQIVTGLTVGGDLNFELAKEAELELFMKSAMLNEWVTSAPVAATLTIDTTLKTITRAAGDWTNEVNVGDVLTLGAFTNAVNNTQVMVIEKQSATVIKYSGPDTMVDETGDGETFQVADYLSIGTAKKSFSMEKAFLDLTDKAIIYKGMIVSTMSLNVTYGEIINGSFSFSGNGYQAVNASGDFITDGRTIDAPATTQSLNGSIDMPFLVTSAVGVLSDAAFCIQSVETTLNNNLTPQTCIGKAAPQDYSPGTAQIETNITAYLEDSDWALLAKKLTQESFGVGYIVENEDGGYGFFYPAVQVSFDDPGSQGLNQDVFLNMSGVAKVGDNGESALRIYRF